MSIEMDFAIETSVYTTKDSIFILTQIQGSYWPYWAKGGVYHRHVSNNYLYRPRTCHTSLPRFHSVAGQRRVHLVSLLLGTAICL